MTLFHYFLSFLFFVSIHWGHASLSLTKTCQVFTISCQSFGLSAFLLFLRFSPKTQNVLSRQISNYFQILQDYQLDSSNFSSKVDASGVHQTEECHSYTFRTTQCFQGMLFIQIIFMYNLHPEWAPIIASLVPFLIQSSGHTKLVLQINVLVCRHFYRILECSYLLPFFRTL